MKKILIIAAHPDDEVLGMGGTIAKYASQGHQIALLIVTNGSTTQYEDNPRLEDIIQKKKFETQKCASILGISHIFYGNLPDMKLDIIAHVEINKVIEKTIKSFMPNVVFTHFYGDINMDHRRVFESTMVACRPIYNSTIKQVFMYSVPSSTEWNIQNQSTAFIPNWFEDISGVFSQKKYEGFKCYETELREYPHPRSVEWLMNSDAAEGNKVGLSAAESFVLIRSINHNE